MINKIVIGITVLLCLFAFVGEVYDYFTVDKITISERQEKAKEDSEETYISYDTKRFINANEEQKECVRTLGQGVYSHKPLTWKLDACNIP